VQNSHYIIGSVVGPDPYPRLVRDFQSVIGREVRAQLSELQRPSETYKPRIDFASCPAWVADSAAACTVNTEHACAITAAGC